jgi:hypothetical protein
MNEGSVNTGKALQYISEKNRMPAQDVLENKMFEVRNWNIA